MTKTYTPEDIMQISAVEFAASYAAMHPEKSAEFHEGFKDGSQVVLLLVCSMIEGGYLRLTKEGMMIGDAHLRKFMDDHEVH